MNAAPAPDSISLLWALPEDASAIAALHAGLFPTAWDSDAIQALIEHPASLALVATRPGREIVGFIIAQIAADEAEILTIGVVPDRQRHGIGRQLVEGVARAAARAEARRIFLDVAASNAPARALYAACGFAEFGRRKSYYTLPGGGRDDALQLSRDLPPA
jgi:[ribosomal protein S18]-alanine N-acetyltransferase